jgi:hypothetical protein
MQPSSTIAFTLQLASHAVTVDVQLRRSGDRWVARVGGSCEATAIALSPGAALAAALAPLGERAVTTLLADLALLAPSLQVVATERAAV